MMSYGEQREDWRPHEGGRGRTREGGRKEITREGRRGTGRNEGGEEKENGGMRIER